MNETWMLMVMAIPLVAIIGGLINAAIALHHRARLKELAIRERIALIEKGITPPPEVDPAGFDREWDAQHAGSAADSSSNGHRTAGVILIGVGVALAMLISLTSGQTAVGAGVGGAVAIVGLAFLINSFLLVADRAHRSGREPAPPSRRTSDLP